MTARFDTGSATPLELMEILRLLHRIGSLLDHRDGGEETPGGRDVRLTTATVVSALSHALNLDRCLILQLAREESSPDEPAALFVSAEFAASQVNKIGHKRYQLTSKSEFYRMLKEGKPLPLKDLITESSVHSGFGEMDQFIKDTESKSILVFPIATDNDLIGCLTMHYVKQAQRFSEEVLEVGEIIAHQLAQSLSSSSQSNSHDLEAKAFINSHWASLIVDGVSGRIKKANQTALQLFGRSQTELIGQTLSKISADGQKLTLALRELDDKTPTTMLSGILVPSAPGHAHHLDAFLSLLAKNARDEVSVILYPTPSERQQERKTKATSTATSASHDKSSPAGDPGSQSSDELAAELANISRELTWERWVRQIICKLHASLDRDTLLQTVVDGFGRALGASRCLIVRTDGPASPMVTHEYAEPDTSPLGLGRTGQFPSVIVSYFRHRVAAIPDLASLERSGELSGQEYEYFLDNGIRGITGAPIASHGFHYGVIIILESGATRKWSAHELDMLEIAATQTAVALGHCQAYLQLKDQLFNMNLLGNLTQQLTNTLEMVSRSGKTEAQDERSHTGGSAATGQAPPLSLRELEVLKLIASGLANREIAQRLFLTESTVELHASRIRKKLKLKSRTALVKYACDNGLA